MLTRGQWIAVIILVFLVIVAIAIAIYFWTRRRPVDVNAVVLPGPQVQTPVVQTQQQVPPAPVVTGGRFRGGKGVQRPISTGATYREILGKSV